MSHLFFLTHHHRLSHFPCPPNRGRSRFSYRAPGGKIDNTGTELTSAGSSISGLGFTALSNSDITKSQYVSGGICNSGFATPTSMGASAQSDYNWSIVIGVADIDFDQGSTCTVIGKLIESSPATNKKPAASGFILMNEGK